MNGYFNLIRTLIGIFTLFSVIAFVQIYEFRSQNPVFFSEHESTFKNFLWSLTIGVYPYSYPLCESVPARLDRLTIGCKNADIISTEHMHLTMVTNYHSEQGEQFRKKCRIDKEGDQYNDPANQEVFVCDKELRNLDRLSQHCQNQTSCVITDFSQYLDPNGKCLKGNLLQNTLVTA